MAIEEWKSNPVQGYFLERSVCETGHSFGGPSSVACPNCAKQMLMLVNLDGSDERIELWPEGVQLLYCWTCNIAQKDLFYSIESRTGIRLIRYGRGGVSSDFPYENYPREFSKHHIGLNQISPETQEMILAVNQGDSGVRFHAPDLRRPRHQVGGVPIGAQNGRSVRCPICRGRMPFLATIADSTYSEAPMTGNEFVQVFFHLCRSCRTIGAYQSSD